MKAEVEKRLESLKEERFMEDLMKFIISQDYCEGNESIEQLVKKFNDTLDKPESDDYQMLISYISTRLSLISKFFLIKRLKDEKVDILELIKLGEETLKEARDIVKEQLKKEMTPNGSN